MRLRGVVGDGDIANRITEALGEQATLAQRMAYYMMCVSLIHQVNAMRGALGEPDAVLDTQIWRHAAGIQSTFAYGDDARVTLTWLFLPGVRHYREEYRYLAPASRVELVFASPYLRHAPPSLRIERMKGERTVVQNVTVSYHNPFEQELLHFYDCVTGGREPDTGVTDAIRDAELMVAMAQAYRR